MNNVIQSHLEEAGNVLVVQAIEDSPPRLAAPNQAHYAEPLQLVGNRRVAHREPRGDLANASLAKKEEIDDA
jgi:hypothetical protein